MWSTPRSCRFTLGKDPVPIVKEAGLAPGQVWKGAENLAPIGIRSPDLPARSQSLYRLSYRGPQTLNKQRILFQSSGMLDCVRRILPCISRSRISFVFWGERVQVFYQFYSETSGTHYIRTQFNPLALELVIYSLAHHSCKM